MRVIFFGVALSVIPAIVHLSATSRKVIMSDHPRYPRFDVYVDAEVAEPRLVAHRVSRHEADRVDDGLDLWGEIRELPANRFRIKCAPGARNPIVVKDASRPAWLGQYPTIERAMFAVDNVVRRERGMPERIDWARVGMYARDLDNSAPIDPWGEFVEPTK